jgi:hypothetical protein
VCLADWDAKFKAFLKVVPTDWDMIFLGGKLQRVPDDESPQSPQPGRNISLDDPWWRVKHILSTFSYAVNHKSLKVIADSLRERAAGGFTGGVDMLFDMLADEDIRVYVPPKPICEHTGDSWGYGWKGYDYSTSPPVWVAFP